MNPNLITKCAEKFGSQSVVVSIDVKKNFFGKKINQCTWNTQYNFIFLNVILLEVVFNVK